MNPSSEPSDKIPKSQIRVVYASAARRPFPGKELRELLRKARIFNTGKGITGLLLYHKMSFLQILEGEPDAVESLLARIASDDRHHRVLILAKESIAERSFGEWSMGFIDLDAATAKLPGFIKLMEAKDSFLDLQGDSKLVSRLVDGFQKGQWRQSVER